MFKVGLIDYYFMLSSHTWFILPHISKSISSSFLHFRHHGFKTDYISIVNSAYYRQGHVRNDAPW